MHKEQQNQSSLYIILILQFSWNHKVNELISNYIVHICNAFACSRHNSSIIKADLLLLSLYVLVLECYFALLTHLCLQGPFQT